MITTMIIITKQPQKRIFNLLKCTCTRTQIQNTKVQRTRVDILLRCGFNFLSCVHSTAGTTRPSKSSWAQQGHTACHLYYLTIEMYFRLVQTFGVT
jgi:hypothetical protein